MAFEIVKLDKEVFSGSRVEIPAFNPQEGFAVMSEVKEAAIADFAKTAGDYVGINANIDGVQTYLVAKSGDGNGDTSFEVKEGQYAKFVTKEKERTAIDGFIGQSYGEIMNSDTVGVAGTFNLEDLREADFTIYIPVVVK
ncbi:effector binding domain-containing protein [Listeria rocourtiae]|uniref:effector binding domain-containing protein n=1 Tax=Listeria rocourtiae TaxID=647910 RepID=UPI003D2F674D